MKQWLAAMAAALLALAGPAQAAGPVVLVVFDGLRPDYVTAEQMPRLHAFGAEGVVFERHHAVTPTVTRVNASSIATGCYPARHGLLDNVIYLPELSDTPINTQDQKSLMLIEEKTGGKLLTAPSLGELLDAAGKRLLVVSSGSGGSALLLNHKGKGAGLIHPEYTLPDALGARVRDVAGAAPAAAYPNTPWIDWAVDAFLRVGVDELKPDVSILWFTDPDHTAHANGMGAPMTLTALQGADAAFGRLLDGLAARGIAADVLAASDHGFASYTGTTHPKIDVDKILRELRGDPRSMTMAGYGLYLEGSNKKLANDFALRLQQLPWVGAVFMPGLGADGLFGPAPGTVSYDAIQYRHPRAPDLMVTPAWNDDPNEFGVPGAVMLPGRAGHGGASAWEIRATLIARGPGFKKAVRSAVPTSNVDLAPTILRLAGAASPGGFDGRTLAEALEGGPDPAGIRVEGHEVESRVEFPDGGSGVIKLGLSIVEGKRYFDRVSAVRTQAPAAAPEAAAGDNPFLAP